MNRPFRTFAMTNAIGVAVLLTVLIGGWFIVCRAWIPHDEGLLGMSAARVLAGERPHVHFLDPYTGALSYLHALSFEIFGVNSLAMRKMLLVAFAATMIPLYGLFLRIFSPLGAGLLTVSTALMMVPLYGASMPSWYVTFFAIWSLWALTRYIIEGRRIWLLLAGVFAGVSIIFKITGVFFMLGVGLFILYREQRSTPPTHEKSWSFFALKSVLCCLLVSGLISIIWKHLDVAMFLHFIFPVVCLVGYVLVQEYYHGFGLLRLRTSRCLKDILPFATGALFSVCLFLLLFESPAELLQVFHGVFVLPQLRIDFGYREIPSLVSFLFVAPLGFWIVSTVHQRHSLLKNAIVASVIPFIIVGIFSDWMVLGAILFSAAYHLPVMLAAVSTWKLAVDAPHAISPTDRDTLFLFVSVVSFMTFSQYPFFAPMYFYYTSPFVMLAAVFLLKTSQFPMPKFGYFFATVFSVFHLILAGGFFFNALRYVPITKHSFHIDSDRSGLLLTREDSERFNRILGLIDKHSGSSDYIYAGPDTPEFYFLSGKRSPIRTPYEFFDPFKDEYELIELLRKKNISLVVINKAPGFSPAYSPGVMALLEREFPDSVNEDGLVIRWRNSEERSSFGDTTSSRDKSRADTLNPSGSDD